MAGVDIMLHLTEKRKPGRPRKADGEKSIPLSSYRIEPESYHYIEKLAEIWKERSVDALRYMIRDFIKYHPIDDEILRMEEHIKALEMNKNTFREQRIKERQNAFEEVEELALEIYTDNEAGKFYINHPETMINMRDERLLKISKEYFISIDDLNEKYDEEIKILQSKNKS
jgi:hypothetical protein